MVKIGILDSGINTGHKAFGKENIEAVSLKYIDGRIIDGENSSDEIGHGTAIHYIMH